MSMNLSTRRGTRDRGLEQHLWQLVNCLRRIVTLAKRRLPATFADEVQVARLRFEDCLAYLRELQRNADLLYTCEACKEEAGHE